MKHKTGLAGIFLLSVIRLATAQQVVIDQAFFKKGTPYVIADFNLDGLNDILGWSDDGYLSCYQQQPGGTASFLPHFIGDSTEFIPSTKMQCVDINGDGAMDVIGSAHYSVIRVLINTNPGALEFSTHMLNKEIGGDYHVNIFETGDIEGDGDLDVLVSFFAPEPKLGWYENNGSSPESFPYHSIPYTDIGGPEDIGLRDFDSDGDLDFYAYDFFNEDLYFFTNDGNENFLQSLLIDNWFIDDLRAVDINNDGHIDIALNQDGSYMDDDGYIEWLENNGDATFQSPQFICEQSEYSGMYLLDFDEDEDTDIFSLKSYYENMNAGESFAPPTPISELLPAVPETGQNFHVVKADMTGDDVNDIVTGVEDNILIFPRNADLTFSAEPVLLTTMWEDVLYAAPANIDGDTIDDIVVVDHDLRISWYGFDPISGTFSRFNRVERIGRDVDDTYVTILIDDFDTDGDDDIITTGYEWDEYNDEVGEYTTYYYQNMSDGSFAPPVTLGFYLSKATVYDLDGDGLKDILNTISYVPTTEVALIKNGDFSAGSFTKTILSSRQVAEVNTIDFDWDGDRDAILLDKNDGNLYALELDGANVIGNETWLTTFTGAYPRCSLFFDDDQDGDDDIFYVAGLLDVPRLFRITNHGDNTYSPSEYLADFYSSFSYLNRGKLYAEDINADGLKDIVFSAGQLQFVKNTANGIPLSTAYMISYSAGALAHISGDSIPEFISWNEDMLWYDEEINDLEPVPQKEVDSEDVIFLFPNPAYDILNFECDMGIKGNYEIFLMDITGRKVLVKEVNLPNRISLDLSFLSAGCYFLILRGEDSLFSRQFSKLAPSNR